MPPGEPCVVEIWNTSGLDDCERGSMCWYVDDDGHGTCHELCVGTASEPAQCPDPDDRCVALGNWMPLCLPSCDPTQSPSCA